MMWHTGEPDFVVDPVLAHAIDVLFILHADHEQNCSTAALRAVGSPTPTRTRRPPPPAPPSMAPGTGVPTSRS